MRSVTTGILCTLFTAFFYAGTAGCGEITIAYTANSSGKLRECGCPGDPYGGFSERVTMIKELRKKEKPFLLVDAGNMVSLYGDHELKASSIFRMMESMGYDAAGVGRLELFNGIGSIRQTAEKADFPLLSASIVGDDSTGCAFKPYEICTINGQKVGIVSICDSTCFIPYRQKKQVFKILPVSESLEPVIAKLTQEAHFIVVLSHMTTETNTQLLKDYPLIDLVIQGYGNKRLKTPEQPSCGFLVAPGSRGQFVGLITLEKSASGNLSLKRSEMLPVLDFKEDKKAAEIVTYYYKNMKIK